MKKNILTALAVTTLLVSAGVSWGYPGGQTVIITSTQPDATSGHSGGNGGNGENGDGSQTGKDGGYGGSEGGDGGLLHSYGGAGGTGYSSSDTGAAGTGGARGVPGANNNASGGAGGGGGGGGDGGTNGAGGNSENVTWVTGNTIISITANGGAGGDAGNGGNGGAGGYGTNASNAYPNQGANGGSGGGGGNGGGAGAGGNGGNIIFLAPTDATLTGGIIFHSAGAIGGAGGDGGDGGSGGSYGTGYYWGSTGATGAGGNGGAGGVGGSGGLISGTNAGTLTTIGIAGRSAGAAGGDGGNGGSGSITGVGGAGGNGGNGGSINLVNQGTISTTVSGTAGFGILSFSQGGKGGNGGSGSISGAAGNGGNGGNVTITNTGTILTSDAFAFGITALSEGAASGTGSTVGTAGNGGNITVNTSGVVSVSGSISIGIFLASTGGDATAAKGDLTVNASGLVSGGLTGVYFALGNSSTLNISNGGIVTTGSGVHGWAVVSDLGSQYTDVINNNGLLIGSVDLVGIGGTALANTNTIYNDGVFYSGTSVNLGAGNTLYNGGGFLLVGGPDSILTTTITGNVNQDSTGVTGFKIGGLTQGITYDSLSVSGSTYANGTLKTYQFNGFVPDPINVRWNRVADAFTVLTSGTLTVAETAKVDDYFVKNYLVRLDQGSLVTGTSLTLVTKQSTFDTLFNGYRDGLTHNERAVAKALDKAIVASDWNGGTDSRADKLIDRLDDLDKSHLRRALDQIAPEELGLLVDVGLGVVYGHELTVLQRLEQLRLTGAPVASAPAPTGKDSKDSKAVAESNTGGDLNGFFLTGNINGGKVDDQDNIKGDKDQSYGGTLGYDRRISDSLLLGVAGSFINNDVKFSSNGKTTVNTGVGSVYGSLLSGNFHFDGILGGGAGSYDVKREGLDGANLKGDTTAAEIHGLLGAGYDIAVNNFTVTPKASLAYTHLWMDGFTEKNSLAPLKIDDFNNTSSLKSRVGSSVNYTTKVADVAVTPEVGLYWQHEFMDPKRSVTARLASGAGGSFTVDSASAERDSLVPAIAVNVKLTPHVDLRVAGEAALFNNAPSYNSTVGVSVGW